MTTELLGDRWTLVVLRDLMFGNRTRFREMLHHSMEGIASNVLASRLKKLTEAGLLVRRPHPDHRQGVDYFLTEPAIQLVPIIIEVGAWGSQWLPSTPELSTRAQMLADGGDELRQRFMDELRSIHIHQLDRPDHGVLADLNAASQSLTQQHAVQ